MTYNQFAPYIFSMLPVLISVFTSYAIFRAPNAGMLPLVVPFWNLIACFIAWAIFDLTWTRLNGLAQAGKVTKTGPSTIQNIVVIAMAIGTHLVMYMLP